jgi:trehalose utilization protein
MDVAENRTGVTMRRAGLTRLQRDLHGRNLRPFAVEFLDDVFFRQRGHLRLPFVRLVVVVCVIRPAATAAMMRSLCRMIILQEAGRAERHADVVARRLGWFVFYPGVASTSCRTATRLEAGNTRALPVVQLGISRIALAVAAVLTLSSVIHTSAGTPKAVRVLVWDEQQVEQRQAYGSRYLGGTIAAYLEKQPGLRVKSLSLSSPNQGLADEVLNATDVVVMWSHLKQHELKDAHAEALVQRVRDGKLGLIALHSAHWAKPFVRLMQERAKADALAQVPKAERAKVRWEYLNERPIGKAVKKGDRVTPFVEMGKDGVRRLTLPQCVFPAWRADGKPSRVTTLLKHHPIAKGLPATWEIPRTEMYGGAFHVPRPDEEVFEETWATGERFRSGSVWKVGKGRVVYFRPGHETYPVYKQAEPLKVVENAIRWLWGK